MGSQPQEDCQEDGDQSARQVLLHLLWQGQDEENGCRHLVLLRQELPCYCSWRCLELLHHCCCQREERREEAQGDEGAVERLHQDHHPHPFKVSSDKIP